MNVRVLVIDDEPLARLGVCTRLAAFSDMMVVGECSTGDEALAVIPRLLPDLLFVDIEMPGLSGIDLLKALQGKEPRCIVFLTAHEEYALDAFNVQALDYLLKPIDDARFVACIERVRRVVSLYRQEARFEQLHELLTASGVREGGNYIRRFPVRKGNEFTFVPATDVDWVEGLGDYAGLHAGSRTHLIRESLTSLEERLDPAQFVRIHRSTIVQVERIMRLDPVANRDAILTLRDSTALRVSRTYRSRLEEILHGA
jgi:two-component system, LytTR family, response regulator